VGVITPILILVTPSKETMVNRPSKLERIAYHESGHAVISTELKLPFTRVSVIEDDKSLGHIIFTLPDWFNPDISSDAKTNTLIEKRILVGLSGLAAVHKLTGRHNWRGASCDVHSAVGLASYRFTHEVAEPYINYLKARARSMMNAPYTWMAVEQLAKKLLEEQQLSAKTARKIIRSARMLPARSNCKL
jgi:ATP-dependent Zn protease